MRRVKVGITMIKGGVVRWRMCRGRAMWWSRSEQRQGWLSYAWSWARWIAPAAWQQIAVSPQETVSPPQSPPSPPLPAPHYNPPTSSTLLTIYNDFPHAIPQSNSHHISHLTLVNPIISQLSLGSNFSSVSGWLRVVDGWTCRMVCHAWGFIGVGFGCLRHACCCVLISDVCCMRGKMCTSCRNHKYTSLSPDCDSCSL